MKLTVVQAIEPVSIVGRTLELFPTDERHVFIDDKPVPPALAKVILLGLDVATEQYMDSLDRELMEEGHDL